jgi:hypothetical protein
VSIKTVVEIAVGRLQEADRKRQIAGCSSQEGETAVAETLRKDVP